MASADSLGVGQRQTPLTGHRPLSLTLGLAPSRKPEVQVRGTQVTSACAQVRSLDQPLGSHSHGKPSLNHGPRGPVPGPRTAKFLGPEYSSRAFHKPLQGGFAASPSRNTTQTDTSS